MDLSPEAAGTFDLVLLLGVLCHLRDPISALERVASVGAGEVGFPSRRTVWRTSLPRRLARAARSARSGRQRAVEAFRSQRIVVHASR